MRRTFTRLNLTLAAAALAAGTVSFGCIGREVAEVEPNQNKEQLKDIPVEINRDIDILFVIDDSGSMEDEQASLQQNFNRFINVLANIEGGLPNVHIGVISTDVGATPGMGQRVPGCENSDNGRLQAEAGPSAPAGCPTPAGNFISDIANPDDSRTTNYPGENSDQLNEVFGCIARLGTSGCGFEQPLESMKRALDGSNQQNAGFLRDNAFLAVIIITDEDDCSTDNQLMFDTSQQSVSDPLGPLTSFRCFEFGVECNPDNPRTTGPKAECAPRENSEYMFPVQRYVDFLKDLKDDPSLVIVAGIIGPPTPVSVGTDANGNPDLDPSCSVPGVANSAARPAIRISKFLEAFPQRNTVTTICNENLSDALTVIAELLATVIGSPCLDGIIKDVSEEDGLQVDCQVSDVRFPGQDNQEETILPECNAADGASATNQPCWLITVNRDACPDSPSGLTVDVYPKNRSVPTGTHTIVRCQAD